MSGSFHFHFIHITGTKIVAQQTNGVPDGCLSEGIVNWDSTLNRVPLHPVHLKLSTFSAFMGLTLVRAARIDVTWDRGLELKGPRVFGFGAFMDPSASHGWCYTRSPHLNHVSECSRIIDCWPLHEREHLIVGLMLHFSFCSPWKVKEYPLLLEWIGNCVKVKWGPESMGCQVS
jgi:hypothetical protein